MSPPLTPHYVAPPSPPAARTPSYVARGTNASRFPLDENSNYFRRAKQPLQSLESVNEAQGPGAAAGQHRSEQDLMYGSKLSTRMQDTARSAWKKSRKFAGSVLAAGGGLSACRRNSKQRASVSSVARRPCVQQREQQQPATVESGTEQHTSVIEVGPTTADYVEQQQSELRRATLAPAEQPPLQVKVDENNKLTIVTKFSQLPGADQEAASRGAHQSLAPSAQAASSSSSHCCPSERSRCESSSSGRGTASASDSAGDLSGSQSGDLAEQVAVLTDEGEKAAERRQQPISPAISSDSSSGCASSSSPEQSRHKRRSSMFKTSRVFSGSQASLNKLRSFFALAASSARTGHHASLDQAALAHSVATLRVDSLSGRALEDMLRESGQGGAAQASQTALPESENRANSDEPMGAEKCQELEVEEERGLQQVGAQVALGSA